MVRRLTTYEFISRYREVHGDKYDYSKTEYVNIGTKDFKAVEDLQKKIKKQMNKSDYTKNFPVCTYG